ncbi:MAG: methionyl-tRNA formyltransferase [Elusimicrobiota bacterium]|jgi:methionyl-tRNA formyltransferase
MRLLFLGSPQEAVPFLEACARAHEVVAVLTQPDRPSGRGLRPTPPPVKDAALRLGLRVLQPARPSEAADELKALGADMAVVVAYGRILSAKTLAATRHGFLNVHFSLLPRWRGAAPVAWALMEGDARTGVTLFWIDEGLDTGPVQRMAEEDVRPEDDARTLMSRLVSLGVRELEGALADVALGRVRREPQTGAQTRAPKLGPEHARLDFSLDASVFHNRVRALAGGPRPFLRLATPRGPLRAAVLSTFPGEAEVGGDPGSVARVERARGVLVECRLGSVWLREVQPEGKKPMSAADFLNGLRTGPGDRLEIIP